MNDASAPVDRPCAAMVLAAGFSSRMRPLSDQIPKPCLPVLGRPLIHYVFDWLAARGVREAGVNLHHLPRAVRAAVSGYAGPPIRFTLSEEAGLILLTAGALAPLRELFRHGGTFILVNGKLVLDIDLGPVLDFHRRSGNVATLVMRPNRARDRFMHVDLGPEGEIRGYVAFDEARGRIPELVTFTGIHLIEPGALDAIPDGQPFDTVKDLYPLLQARGERVRGFLAEGEWREFSTPRRYLDHSLAMLRERGLKNWTTWRLELHGAARAEAAVFGEQVEVEAGAVLRRSLLLGDNRVGRGARLTDCIVGPGADIPAGSRFEQSVIVRADSLTSPCPGCRPEGDLAIAPLA